MLAIGASVAAVGPLYYAYQRRKQSDRVARELEARSAEEDGGREDTGSHPSTPIDADRTPGGRGELGQEERIMVPPTPVSEVRAYLARTSLFCQMFCFCSAKTRYGRGKRWCW